MTPGELLQKLIAIELEVEQRFQDPWRVSSGLSCLGLGFKGPKTRGGYSPGNSRPFAHTGGEGVRFSFLNLPDLSPEEGPVVMTRPGCFHEPNTLVGESLFEFLCLGCRCGYRLLEYLGEGLDVSRRLYDLMVEDDPGAEDLARYQQDVLDYLVERLNLEPWADVPSRLAELEVMYGQHLELKEPG